MATILVLDDDAMIRTTLEQMLLRAEHRPLLAGTVVEALQFLARDTVDLIISDFRLPGLTGLEFLGLLRDEGYDVPLIVITGYGSIEHAVAAIKAGAVDYITKPVRAEQLQLAVEQALEVVRLRRENDALREEVVGLRSARHIVGDSVPMRRVLQAVAMAAPTRATVLLQGESGTGKELFARALHDQSDRRARPFIKLNCAALPEGLVESALFGHEKGAFTGAIKRVEGAFERANGGTLLLDEISEMRLDLQAKLLRVLQEQEFERVGGTAPIKVNVRIIATTNRDIAGEVARGAFRQDLFYRLTVLPLYLPPLRERADDIPLLALRFAMSTANEMGKEITSIAPEAMRLLQEYAWPGNVRELQHAVERAVILSTGPVLQPANFELGDGRAHVLPSATGTRRPVAPSSGPGDQAPDGAVVLTSLNVDHAQDILIAEALARTGQNRTQAARLLGMSVRTLRAKLNAPAADGTMDADAETDPAE
ncbi:MAG: sigma-54-dependent Fis family transcriptional regulator [Gemmatimonadota bacterium]|nr:sigma-54-dependent Fis family transcriptional regulator [Gemmatimonadota bacterium]